MTNAGPPIAPHARRAFVFAVLTDLVVADLPWAISS